MNILFIGKRFYTNRDALMEKYGRIYQLPYHWSKEDNIDIKLWLIDYHSLKSVITKDEELEIISTPVKNGFILKQYFKENYKKEKYDVVVASGDCYIGLLGYKLAKTHKAKFVFDIYDKYDEFGAYFNLFWFNSYQFLLKNSDVCLFASAALANSLKNSVKQSIIAPNGIDTSMFKTLDKRACCKQLGLEFDNIYIGYFGSLDQERGSDDLITAHQTLLKQGYNYHLLIGGKKRPNLNLSRKNLTYLGNMSYAQVPVAMGACDLLTLPYRRSPYLDMASSCKIAEYLAMQVPIVATRTPNIEENFHQQAIQLTTVLAEPGQPETLALKIKEQLNEKLLASTSDEYSYATIAQTTLQLLSNQ